MLDEARCFLGLKLMFPHKKAAPGISSSGGKRYEPDKDLILGHWLQPVEGTATDHLMVLRKLTRKTLQADTTPDPFTFDPVTTCDYPNQWVVSNAVTITGINTTVSISISSSVSCEYSINGGAFLSVTGTVNNNDIVVVRVESAGDELLTTQCTLQVGGTSGTFEVTTGSSGACFD